ncbi:MAG: putative multiple sugar transport system substrate-binding protein [Actinomycetota bacterium]|nr:putative multiple sugar transport system substrate-binding protein [Actinomycetota bacterium]
MRSRTVSRSLGVMVLGVLMLSGCSGASLLEDLPDVDRGLVGVLMPTKDDHWEKDGVIIAEQLRLLGYRPELVNAENDAQTQKTQLEGIIGKNPRALVIGAVDGTVLAAPLDAAGAKDIPVISFDRLIRGSAHVDYYAAYDNAKVGTLQAEYLIDTLGLAAGKGPFTIELFAGSPNDNNATYFFKGAMAGLRPYLASGKLVVVSKETAFSQVAIPGWKGEDARARMAKLLTAHYAGRRVDAVLSPNDGLARGIIQALGDAGYGKPSRPYPAITGQDAQLDSVKLIAKGIQGHTIDKDMRELAKVAVQMVNSVLTGGTPEVNDTTQYHNGAKVVPTFLLAPVSVTKANYQRILVDGGVFSAEQIRS